MATYVLPGWIVSADVTWKNKGEVDYAPEFRLDLKKKGVWPETWVDDASGIATSPLTKPGETAVVEPKRAIPKGWGAGTKISVQIVLIGREGAMWGPNGWWKSEVGIDILEVPEPSPDWVEIISVTPYTEAGGPI